MRDSIQDEHVEESAAGTWSQSSARQSHTEEPNTGETRLRDRPRHSLRGLQGPTRGVTGARDRCDAAARPARSCRPALQGEGFNDARRSLCSGQMLRAV